ncbi:MAG: LemA family protein [Coriobacteriia bacterium]|nr:LemA family protein [Coriobacteriia bacterium]
MKKSGIIIGLVVLAIVAMSLIGTYNRLVNLDNEVETQWAQIDNQLKRRADLIPNLVNTVKGFAAQEKDIMTAIADSRARLAGAASPAEAAEADAELTGALGRLLVIVENYPDLKSDQTFIRLMDELSGTENRISVARKDYNETVRDYNLAVRTFPTNLIAPIMGFEKAEFFEISESDRETPEVDFGNDE